MTGLVRKALLLSAVGLVVAGAAVAGVPNAGNSTKPGAINMTGYTNPPDPAGNVLYVIRDLNNIPVANAEIVLDFTACTDVKLSQNVNGNGGVTTCGSNRITGQTNGLGVLTLSSIGGGNGTGPVRGSHDCVLVTVNSVPFPNINAATFDRNSAGGVVSGDLTLVLFDAINNPGAGRSDFNNDGAVTSSDISLLLGVAIGGGSANSGTPCP